MSSLYSFFNIILALWVLCMLVVIALKVALSTRKLSADRRRELLFRDSQEFVHDIETSAYKAGFEYATKQLDQAKDEAHRLGYNQGYEDAYNEMSEE